MHPGADALTRTAERPRQRVGDGPRMRGHRGVGPSNRDHPEHARVPSSLAWARAPPMGAEAPALAWGPRWGKHQNNQPSRRKKGGGFGRPPWARYRDNRAGGARRGPGTSARYRSSARFNRRHARHKPRRFAALLVPPLCTGRTVAIVSGPPAPQRAHPSSPLLGAAVPRRNAGPSPPSNRNSLMRALSRKRSRAHSRSARCATKTPAAHSRGRPGIGEM
jgi:hypothetical protein